MRGGHRPRLRRGRAQRSRLAVARRLRSRLNRSPRGGLGLRIRLALRAGQFRGKRLREQRRGRRRLARGKELPRLDRLRLGHRIRRDRPRWSRLAAFLWGGVWSRHQSAFLDSVPRSLRRRESPGKHATTTTIHYSRPIGTLPGAGRTGDPEPLATTQVVNGFLGLLRERELTAAPDNTDAAIPRSRAIPRPSPTRPPPGAWRSGGPARPTRKPLLRATA